MEVNISHLMGRGAFPTGWNIPKPPQPTHLLQPFMWLHGNRPYLIPWITFTEKVLGIESGSYAVSRYLPQPTCGPTGHRYYKEAPEYRSVATNSWYLSKPSFGIPNLTNQWGFVPVNLTNWKGKYQYRSRGKTAGLACILICLLLTKKK